MGTKLPVTLILLLPALLIPALMPSARAAQSPLLWQKTWGAAISRAVAVDSSGNSYVTGFTSISDPFLDAFLLKFDSSGGLAWARNWGASGHDDVGSDVAVDASGNIYVTGTTESFGAHFTDIFLLKSNSAGSLLWQAIWEGAGWDAGYGVAVDPSNGGNIYVTGATNSFGAGSEDVVLFNFDSSGSLRWQRTWGGSTDDEGNGVAVDSSGSVYVTGASSNASQADLFLLKFNSTGNLLWQEALSGNLRVYFGYGYVPRVAVDSSRDIYVSGTANSSGTNDVLLLKFNSTGGLLWQKTWGGTSDDSGSGVATDASGNVYTAGMTSSAGTLGSCSWGGEVWYTCHDAVLLKFNPVGSLFLQSTWGAVGDDYGSGVAVDRHGNAIVAGTVSEAGPYTLNSTGFTLGTPTFTTHQLNYTTGTPILTPNTSTGTVGTPLGTQSYSGGNDVFLLKFGSSSAAALPAVGALLAAFATSATVALKRCRQRQR